MLQKWLKKHKQALGSIRSSVWVHKEEQVEEASLSLLGRRAQTMQVAVEAVVREFLEAPQVWETEELQWTQARKMATQMFKMADVARFQCYRSACSKLIMMGRSGVASSLSLNCAPCCQELFSSLFTSTAACVHCVALSGCIRQVAVIWGSESV